MAPSYENTRLILAIDYGTTFSGISYAESPANDPRDIHVWTKYPGIRQRGAENSCKAPSVIALPKENEAFGLEEAAWGYEIEPGMKTYSWTKLLLDDDTKRTKYDNPKIDQFFGAGMQELPSGYEASDLVKEYLQGVHKVVWSWLQRSFGKAQLDYMPIDVWVTVPAVWSERAKHLTRNAAYEAGFATRAGDTIKVIAEPAAAAHITIPTTLKESPGKIKENEGLLVCDAGGGTVDITTYVIQKIRPRLVLDEIVVGAGGKCGGSFIDRNLHDLLIERFGDSYTSVSEEERGPGSNFMNIFEGFKRGFSSSTALKKPTRLRLELPAITNDPNLEAQHKEHYSTKTKSILLSHHDWKRMFDPVVKKVINLVRDQVADAKNMRPIKVLILVGGFGESEYLSERLKRFCRENDIWLTSPSEGAWSAVVRGAVLRGLEDDIVRRSRSRRHYGIIVTEAYVPYKHDHIPQDGQDVFLYTDPETEELRMSGMTLWTIPRGQVMLPDSDFNVSIYKSFSLNSKKDTKFAVHLYACGEASPPIAYDESKIEPVGDQVSCSFENIDWDSTIKRAPSGKDYYHVDLIVQLRPADKLGLMTMKILHDGVMVGKGELEVR